MNHQTESVPHGPPLDEFERLLRAWETWYRLRRAAKGAVLGVLFGLALWSVTALAAMANGLLTRGDFIRLGTASVLLITLVGMIVALLFPVSRIGLARFFDRTFRLRERASTALELRALPLEQASPEMQALVASQRADTLENARVIHPNVVFFFPITRWQPTLFAALLVINAGMLFLGQAPFQHAAQQRQVQQAIRQAAEQIDSIAAQVAEDPALSTAQREHILQALEQANQELQNANTPEQAIAALTSAAEQLQALDSPQAAQQAEALRQAGNQLQQSSEPGQANPLADFASNLAGGDFLAAAQDLQAIDPTQLTPEEATALADQLEAAADSLAESNPDLSASLDQAAEALRQGDTQAAQQALQQASGQLAQTGQQVADAQAAQQTASQVAQGQQQLLQAAGQAQAQGSQPGQGSQAGTGSQPGQGTSNGADSSGSSADSSSGKGESSGSETQGSEAGSNPIQPGSPGDGGLKPYEQIYAPQRLGPGDGETVTLPPSNQSGGQVSGTGDTAPGQLGASNVPYTNVYADYAQAYWQAYDSGSVPASMRELVRKYFSSLGSSNP